MSNLDYSLLSLLVMFMLISVLMYGLLYEKVKESEEKIDQENTYE